MINILNKTTGEVFESFDIANEAKDWVNNNCYFDWVIEDGILKWECYYFIDEIEILID